MLNVNRFKISGIHPWIEFCPRHNRCYVIRSIDPYSYYVCSANNKPYKQNYMKFAEIAESFINGC